MSKNRLYVLDEELVVAVLKQFDGKLSDGDPLDALLNSITKQMEPLPAGLGAVIQIHDGRRAVRADTSAIPWGLAAMDETGTTEWLDDGDLEQYRPFTVLSRGVDEL